jgi:replicative DNA helicase
MKDFEILKQEVINGLEGKNSGIPMGFKRLNKYIGIRKRIYTLIFGAPGSGKSAFCHSAFILHPFDWWYTNRDTLDVKLKFILFSMERSKVYTLAKWTSRKIFLDQGINIPIAKLLGWWDTKLTKDEHDLFLMYEDYINELCEVCTIIEGAQNPTGVYKYLKKYAESEGKIEEISEYEKVYLPNHPNNIVIPIIDHFGLLKPEKSMNKKEAIDKASEYFQWARDFLGYTPIGVSQLNRNLSNPMYQKMDSFEPSLDDVKESGRPAEDSDVVISLFQPSRYKTNDASYNNVSKFISPEGADCFRSIKILKNTYGESDLRIGMGFHGSTGTFAELPKPKHMEGFDYESLFTGQFFLQ